MADEQIRDYVLQRADDDTTLSDEARYVVLAAFGDPGDLDEVLSDEATPQATIDALTTRDAADHAPVGAYLTSISVQGFRGIGAAVTVALQPGPGLVVIAGRNGSGKSTLAEGLELALTGINSRWEARAQCGRRPGATCTPAIPRGSVSAWPSRAAVRPSSAWTGRRAPTSPSRT